MWTIVVSYIWMRVTIRKSEREICLILAKYWPPLLFYSYTFKNICVLENWKGEYESKRKGVVFNIIQYSDVLYKTVSKLN